MGEEVEDIYVYLNVPILLHVGLSMSLKAYVHT